MKTNILKPIRWWTLVLCCVLLSVVRAQDVETPAAGKDATVQAPSDEDDKSTSEADTDSTQSNRHRHRHHDDSGEAVVSIGHKAELLAGEHADSVIAIFGSATSAGDVDNAVVSILGRTHVTGKVGDAVVAVMGSVYVNSEVEGDVVSILGNVELGPEARVRGNVVIVGGELTRDPSATIDGHVQTIFSTDWEGFDWLRPWVERCLLYGRPLAFAPGLGWAWGIALGLLALYVFIAFLFRGPVEHCIQTFESKPGHSILAALLTMLLTPVLFVLLFVTVLGIAAIPFLAFALLCAAAFGKVVVLASIGRRCTPMLANDPVRHTVVGVLVGGAIVLVLYTIPFLGFLIYKLLGILGLGVVVYALLIAVRSGRQARAAARNGGLGPDGGAGPGGGARPGGGAGPGGSAVPGGGAGPEGGVGSLGSAGLTGGEGNAGSAGLARSAGPAAGAGPATDAGPIAEAGIWAGQPMGSGPLGGGAQAMRSGPVGGGAQERGPGPVGSRAQAAAPGPVGGGAQAMGFGPGEAEQPTGSRPAGSDAQAGAFSGAATGAAAGAGAAAAGTTAGATPNDRPAFGDFNARPEPPPSGFASSSSSSSTSSTGGFTSSVPPGSTPPPGSTGQSAGSMASLPRAGFLIRMGALLLDVILVGIVLHQVNEGTRLELLVLATYGAVMWKLKASTIGGIICGLQVVRLDGRPIDWPTAIVRALSCFLSLAIVGLGFLWIAIDSERQSWHDKIAGTVVVRAPKGVSLL